MKRETGRMISLMGAGVIFMCITAVIVMVGVVNVSKISAREPETPPGLRLGFGGTLRDGAAGFVETRVTGLDVGLAGFSKEKSNGFILYWLYPVGNFSFGLGWADRLTNRLGSRLNFAVRYEIELNHQASIAWTHFSNGSLLLRTPDTSEYPNIGEDVVAVIIRF